jgi:hypothetical protein
MCPRCQSLKTGIIEPDTETLPPRLLYRKQYKSGHLIRYVDVDRYRSYYVPCGVNAFCSECGYEFVGEERKLDIPPEKIDKYRREKGLTNGDEYIITGKKFKRKLLSFYYLLKP